MLSSSTDIFYDAASIWNELTEYNYIFTYGYKNTLYTISLTFSQEDFPHLAGFQYLKDITLPRYNPEKIVSLILDGTITLAQIEKASQYTTVFFDKIKSREPQNEGDPFLHPPD